MSLQEIIKVGNLAGGTIMLILLMSLIQISPLRLNPWDRIFRWLGRKLNCETDAELRGLREQLQDLWIDSHRQGILRFARECRAEIIHSSDEWGNILTMAANYEAYCHKNGIVNGVIRADIEFIRNLYQELSREHRL